MKIRAPAILAVMVFLLMVPMILLLLAEDLSGSSWIGIHDHDACHRLIADMQGRLTEAQGRHRETTLISCDYHGHTRDGVLLHIGYLDR